MAFFSDTANVKVGVNSRNHFNLSNHVICTQEISRIQPIFKRLLVPGDKFKVSPQSFHRLAPLPVPTYGNLFNVTRAFFVPLRTIFKGFEHFLTQTPLQTYDGLINPNVPKTRNDVFFLLFVRGFGWTEQFPGLTEKTADIVVSSGPFTGLYRFTEYGKALYNLLMSLGIRINMTIEDQTPISLLPILAYARIYFDWYYPSQYVPTQPFYQYFEDPNLYITDYVELGRMLGELEFYERIEKDFFTSAWPSPSGPSGLNPIALQNDRFGSDSAGDPLIVENSSTLESRGSALSSNNDQIASLTQYGLNTLKAVQDFVNRDMIAGNRYIEQMFARYGVKVPDAWLQRAEYLGSHKEPIQISDVMSTAGTDDAALGDYAGKGISYDKSFFEYEAKEFGYFLVFNCVIAETGYVQGRDKDVMYTDPFDFFTPEFDQLGAAPIRNDEIFACYKNDQDYHSGLMFGGKADGIFGFHEQYYEYKNSRDYLLGDFSFPSRGQNLQSYHLFREFPAPDAEHPLALNAAFSNGNPYTLTNQFTRIFQNVGSIFDHVMSEHFVEVSASRPMHSSADSLVTEGGREIDMSFGGYQF